MTFRELFEKCLADNQMTVNKSIDKKNKEMILSVFAHGVFEKEDELQIAYTYKGDKPTQEDAENMYKSIIANFVKRQLSSYAKGVVIDINVKLKDGKEYEI